MEGMHRCECDRGETFSSGCRDLSGKASWKRGTHKMHFEKLKSTYKFLQNKILLCFQFFNFFLIGGKLLYIVVLVSLSSLPWHARGGLKVVVTGRFSTCCVYTILHRAGAVLRASHLLLRAHLILTVILLRSDPFCRANKQ